MAEGQDKAQRKKFPPSYWLVILFEFFERGSYYGMMSILSVYFTDELLFRKESVGIIKSTIQPLLYFLPIISGALADRFGYRKMLTLAFAFLGLGYFLTARVTDYGLVFLALVVMGFGAGMFKPIISGTIARVTDESNSTMGFGIYYWSINLGAFLFPLILVPWLKSSLGWHWVIYAAAIGTGSMLIPTLLFYREPPRQETEEEEKKRVKKEQATPLLPTIITTVANAFEIVYSPVVLVFNRLRSSAGGMALMVIVLAAFFGYAVWDFSGTREASIQMSQVLVADGDPQVTVKMDRDQLRAESYAISRRQLLNPNSRALVLVAAPGTPDAEPGFDLPLPADEDLVVDITRPGELIPASGDLLDTLQQQFQLSELTGEALDEGLRALAQGRGNFVQVTVYKPNRYEDFKDELLAGLREHPGLAGVSGETLDGWIGSGDDKTILAMTVGAAATEGLSVEVSEEGHLVASIAELPETVEQSRDLLAGLRAHPGLTTISATTLDRLLEDTAARPFFYLFVALLLTMATVILFVERWFKNSSTGGQAMILIGIGLVMLIAFWALPGLSLFARILSTVIFSTVLSLLIIEQDDPQRFRDHFRFLLMIFLYSGFWVLYFQMFDSVCWYVKAYVDATPLNNMMNAMLGGMGINNWRFDVEHVTVINAGTIIMLQLLVSKIVKNTKALPTMIFGILLGTIGMAILAINTSIWVFLLGIGIFSIGEMTAHPKFISYIGQTAPRDKVAMYMGYIFLYGVIGSSIGGVLGANLYVTFVDELNRPKTLWLIFSMIGVATIAGLWLYNRFLAAPQPSETNKA
jgi:dipeptide/tripeptide permease